MRIHAKDGARGTLTDLDSGRVVRFVRWYDIETGEVEFFLFDPEEAKKRGVPLRSLIRHRKGRFRFDPARIMPASRQIKGPPLDELRKEALKGEIFRPIILLPGEEEIECCERGCHRPASWAVTDEQEVEPQTVDNQSFERAVAVRSRAFCDWHYRPPSFTDIRGVEREAVVMARPD
jgi:hypothetical protein